MSNFQLQASTAETQNLTNVGSSTFSAASDARNKRSVSDSNENFFPLPNLLANMSMSIDGGMSKLSGSTAATNNTNTINAAERATVMGNLHSSTSTTTGSIGAERMTGSVIGSLNGPSVTAGPQSRLAAANVSVRHPAPGSTTAVGGNVSGLGSVDMPANPSFGTSDTSKMPSMHQSSLGASSFGGFGYGLWGTNPLGSSIWSTGSASNATGPASLSSVSLKAPSSGIGNNGDKSASAS